VALVYGAWLRYVDRKIGILNGKVEAIAITVRVAVKSFFFSVFILQAMNNY
jgi:hypothetical protein